MERRGNSTVGLLICLVVFAAAGLILFLVNRQVLKDAHQKADMSKMIKIYQAAFLYSNVHDDEFPPNLEATRRDVGDTETFQSSEDPFTSGTDFPMDPAFPSSAERSPFRISFTYLPDWIERKVLPRSSLQRISSGSPSGFIACYWSGTIATDRPDGLNTRGDIIRLNTDGSIVTLDGSRFAKPLDGKSLFLTKR